MANIDFIPITPGGGERPYLLNTAIASVRQALRDIGRVQGVMLHLNDGSDWSALETAFGLPTGKGSAVFTLVDGALQVLDGTSSGYAKELMDRVGVS